MTLLANETDTYSNTVRGRQHTFQAGDLVTCWKSGYFVVEGFYPLNNRMQARVKKIYKTKEAMRRPSTYHVRAESLYPVTAMEVERMYSQESERARTKYNTLIEHARN